MIIRPNDHLINHVTRLSGCNEAHSRRIFAYTYDRPVQRLPLQPHICQGGFMLETSVSAPEALAAVGMKDSGLTVLSDAEREKLIALVLSRLM